MIGIPYLHVVPCVNHKRIQLEDLCNEYYKVDTFRKVYFDVVHPLLEVDHYLKKYIINCSTSKT